MQWDPERSLTLQPLAYRAIQIGLSGEAVRRYVDDWIRGITDVTRTARDVRKLVADGERDAAEAALPEERVYPLPEAIRDRIAATIG